jgi:hypothetical protein
MTRARRLSVLIAMSLAMTLFVVSPADATGGGNGLSPLACLQGRWTTYVTTTGKSFPNVWACVFYSLRGGRLVRAKTISFTSPNPSPVTVGGTYTPTASATSGLPVAITVDPASTSVCSRSGTVVTFDAVGACTINANQPGDTSYDPGAPIQQAVTVQAPAVNSSQVCQSLGGVFTSLSATSWRCNAVPDPGGTNAFRAPLESWCLADGGIGLGGVPNDVAFVPDRTWTIVCFGSAIDVFLWVSSAAVAGAIQAAFYPGMP